MGTSKIADAHMSHGDKLRGLNLNLLPPLCELLRQRSVGRAAATLNMSQSAMSDALARLRAAFGDDILVPAGRGFDLSPLAREIEPITAEIIDHIEGIFGTRPFALNDAVGRVRIAAPDTIVMSLGPPLVDAMTHACSTISVQFQSGHPANLDDLSSGLLDLAFIYAFGPPAPQAGILYEYLYEVELVLLASADLADDHAIDEIMCRAGAALRQGDVHEPIFESAHFTAHGTGKAEVILLPMLRVLPMLTSSRNVGAILPRWLTDTLVESGLFKELRMPLPTASAFVAWRRARNSDPLHLWLLETIYAIRPLQVIMSADQDFPAEADPA